jgi:hypothetical protein
MFNKFIPVYPCVNVFHVKELSFTIAHIWQLASSHHIGNNPFAASQIDTGLFNGDKL